MYYGGWKCNPVSMVVIDYTLFNVGYGMFLNFDEL